MGTESKMAQDGAKEPEECEKRQRKRGPAPETHTEWMWNDSTSPISLGCQSCCGEVGASDQAIQAFRQPQALYASSLGELTTVHPCFCWTPIALMQPPPSVVPPLQPYFLSPSLKCASLSFVSFSLILPPLDCFTPLPRVYSFKDLNALPLKSLRHSTPTPAPTLHPPTCFPGSPRSDCYLIPLRRK